jgi:Glyoxalase-like domain
MDICAVTLVMPLSRSHRRVLDMRGAIITRARAIDGSQLRRLIPGGMTAGCRAHFYDRYMTLEWEQTIVDSRDPASLGTWWRDALGWIVVNDDPEEFEIRPSPNRLPGLLFVRVPEAKSIKNRLHLDFRPDDRDAEVDRLLTLGATRADVGQGKQSWVVLADPEGNEFCILGSHTSEP